jgi:hypothetical protein
MTSLRDRILQNEFRTKLPIPNIWEAKRRILLDLEANFVGSSAQFRQLDDLAEDLARKEIQPALDALERERKSLWEQFRGACFEDAGFDLNKDRAARKIWDMALRTVTLGNDQAAIHAKFGELAEIVKLAREDK